MTDLVIYADRGSLLNRLERLSADACDCSPKTAFIRDHSRGCQWRIYQEAIILLKSDDTKIERLQAENGRLREALEGWMIDHGDRCRICTERSQAALKEQT